MKSWKTTFAGIMGFIVLAWGQLQYMLDTDPTTNPEWNIVIGAFMTLLTGLFARDNDVSSEKAGANKD